MTVELKVNLTNEEKNILRKARELTNNLGDTIRDIADSVTGLEQGIIDQMYNDVNVCDDAWVKLSDLCDAFEIN